MQRLDVRSRRQIEVIDITENIEKSITSQRGKMCFVFAPHTTAALTINEAESGLMRDIEEVCSMLLPKIKYEHNLIDNNAEAHILSSFFKPSLLIPMNDGRLLLGTWQRVLFIELDGPRQRKVWVDVI
jgi:secondary thiamine-phosphate synthase enzyme